MLKISRISRSIITAIYIIAMCFCVYLCVIANNASDMKIWQIVVYIFTVILLVYFYQILKRRVTHKTESTAIINIYKFVYIAVVLIISRIIMVYLLRDTVIFYETDLNTNISTVISDMLVKLTGESKYASLIINTTVTYLCAILIRQIMLNVYENDAIATMTSIVYILSPASLSLCMEYSFNIYNALFVLLGIYILFKIFDDIVLYGYKHKRYLYLAIILSFIVFMDILFGGSTIAWLIPLIALNFVADYIDSEYISIDKNTSIGKIISKIFKNKFAIKKSIIVIVVVSVFAVVSLVIGIVTNLNDIDFTFRQGIVKNINDMFGKFKIHYILIAGVVILFEIMGIIMKRKGNAKVSIIKLYSTLYFIIAVLYTSATYSLAIYDAIFSMAVMLSVGNIYYNRDEKIKLLKEKN